MQIHSEMVANVWRVSVAEGDVVEPGTELVVLESMKMEIPVESPIAGTVMALPVVERQVIAEGDLIAEIG